LLPESLSQSAEQRTPGDVALVTPPGTLAGLPFEAALRRDATRFLFRQPFAEENQRDTITWFQRWLNTHGFQISIDGVAGPQFWDSLEQAEKELRILSDGWDGLATRKRMCPPQLVEARVVVLEASMQEQHSRERGYSAYGMSLERLYGERGIRGASVSPDFAFHKRLMDRLGGLPRPVLHVTLDLVDAREGAALRLRDADLNNAMNEGRGGSADYWESEITANRLGVILGRGGPPSVFVILDPPHPGNPREWARQLVLRNQFALELLATRSVWGVLATGLVGPGREQSEQQIERLVASIATRPCAGELARVCDRFSSLFCWDSLLPVW
jgi:hypothetical protein